MGISLKHSSACRCCTKRFRQQRKQSQFLNRNEIRSQVKKMPSETITSHNDATDEEVDVETVSSGNTYLQDNISRKFGNRNGRVVRRTVKERNKLSCRHGSKHQFSTLNRKNNAGCHGCSTKTRCDSQSETVKSAINLKTFIENTTSLESVQRPSFCGSPGFESHQKKQSPRFKLSPTITTPKVRAAHFNARKASPFSSSTDSGCTLENNCYDVSSSIKSIHEAASSSSPSSCTPCSSPFCSQSSFVPKIESQTDMNYLRTMKLRMMKLEDTIELMYKKFKLHEDNIDEMQVGRGCFQRVILEKIL